MLQPPGLIVVGAGLAGLSAALMLHEAGLGVLVLEARQRVGGRVYTIRGFPDDQYAEGGAELIDLDHRLMAAYMGRFGLQRAPELRPYDSAILGGRVMPFGHPTLTKLPDALRGLVRANLFSVDLRRQYFQPYWERLLAQHQGRTEQAMTALQSRSVRDCLTALHASPAEMAYLRMRLIPSEGVELEHIPVLCLEQGPWPEHYATLQYKIAGGNDLLPRHMSALLGDRIRLGCEVLAIDQTPDEAAVSFRRGRERDVVRASGVVLAVPVPALRHIAFEPPLSPEKTAALEAVSYGQVLKVQCAFAERFWQGQGWHGNLVTDLPLRVWHATESQPGTGGILTCSLAGAPTRLARQLSQEALVEMLFRELAPALGGWKGLPERVIATDWVGDAFAGGGWMVEPLPSHEGLRALLGEPHGRCFFAGEHLATEYSAFMEGALRSGHQTARQLIATLASGDARPRSE
jgi:monoamine oxidase